VGQIWSQIVFLIFLKKSFRHGSYILTRSATNQLGQKVAQDDEAVHVVASFKRLIANTDEMQQVIHMSKKPLGKELSLHELQDLTKEEAVKWSREGGIKKKPKPNPHPTPKPHDKPHEPKPKEHKGFVAERGKLEVCTHWAIERLLSCGHEEEGKT